MNFEGFSSGNRYVEAITTDISSIIPDLTESHEKRLESRGKVFTKDELIPVYFCAVMGMDNPASYNNLLFNLREKLSSSDKCLIFKNTEFAPPTPNEISAFDGVEKSDKESVKNGICQRICVPGDKMRTAAAAEAFKSYMENNRSEIDDFYNNAVTLGCLFNRIYSAILNSGKLSEIPVLLFYGKIKPIEISLLHILSRSGMDVIYINPDKSELDELKLENVSSRMQIFEFPESGEIIPYPEKEVKTKIKTVAYNAERSLDTVLYGSDTLFRDFQFSDMKSSVLSTTYDEIQILWNQPARFRPGFEVNGDKVTVPVIFAKISGVNDGNMNKYWDSVKDKLTPETVLTIKAPSYREPDEYAFREYDPYHDGHHLFIDKLKNSRANKYGFLSEELQELIMNKIQEVYDSDQFDVPDSRERMKYLILAGMTIDRNVLRILQKYDFTKDIPKLIIIDNIEDTFSKIECAQILLFSALGFDILVYAPTGYRDLETFVKDEAFETHQLNDFEYNAKIPKFKIPEKSSFTPPDKTGEGFFSRLFKKGRN